MAIASNTHIGYRGLRFQPDGAGLIRTLSEGQLSPTTPSNQSFSSHGFIESDGPVLVGMFEGGGGSRSWNREGE